MPDSKEIEIRQHNAITTARYDYTACQLDILFYLLSKLRKEDAPDKTYRFYNRDIEAMTGRQWNYQQLREATEDMGSRMSRIGKGELSYGEVLTVDQVLARIDTVTPDDCREVAADVLRRQQCLAVVGPFAEADFADALD